MSPRARHAIVLALALVIFLGFPRLLVVCSGPHCADRIQLLHATGSCCGDELTADGDGDCASPHDSHSGSLPSDDEEQVLPAGCGCTDVPLAIDEGPAPEPPHFVVNATTAIASVAWQPIAVLTEGTPLALPPPTGPPRTDQRIELLATTLLLL